MKARNFKVVFFILFMIGTVAGAGPAGAVEATAEQTAEQTVKQPAEQTVKQTAEQTAGEWTEEEALAFLKEGNARFVAMKLEHPDVDHARLEETAVNGQKPFAIVLGCADSRVPVEMIFDQGIGDIFTVRVAGNIAVDSSVIGSLEYAAGRLHVPLLVILGHTQCELAAAAVSGEKSEGSLLDIQKQLEPVVKEVRLEYPELKEAALTTEVAKRNAFQVERDLRSESEVIRGLVDKGGLKIVPAVYDVKTGKVDWLEES